jgi:hypothetical protein
MPATKYDIYTEQGGTFKLHLHYKTRAGVGIDLSGFNGEMQVRRSASDPEVLLWIDNNGVTGGGTTGEFDPVSGGEPGSGGITFGVSATGASLTGGILISVDDDTMLNVPAGRHLYDFRVTNTLGETQRLIEGFFEVAQAITR